MIQRLVAINGENIKSDQHQNLIDITLQYSKVFSGESFKINHKRKKKLNRKK